MPNKVDVMLENARADESVLSADEVLLGIKKPKPAILLAEKPRNEIFGIIPLPEETYQPPSNIVNASLDFSEPYYFPELKVCAERVIYFY